jgi:hypothetical protein
VSCVQARRSREIAGKQRCGLSSLRLYFTLAEFYEYLTNSYTFNKLSAPTQPLLQDCKFTLYSYFSKVNA